MTRNIIRATFYAYTHKLKTGKNFLNYVYMFKGIFINKEYDINVDLNNKVIFDIGANMGLFSLWINDNFKNTEIHCFEPVPELFNILEHNIKVNAKNNNQLLAKKRIIRNSNKTFFNQN